MRKALFSLALSAAALVGFSGQAIAANDAQSRDQCLEAIQAAVRGARVGEPAKPIPRWIQRRASRVIRQAVREELSREQAYNEVLNRLSRIQNEYWRSDLANAAADLVVRAQSDERCQ